MDRLIIRKAEEKDLETIVMFNKAMALETENKSLNHETVASGVRNLFRNPQFGFYLIVEIENEICACLMITSEWSDWRDGLFWWIQSVYVKPAFRGKGIYSKMYDYVKDLATHNPLICGFRLYVEKSNERAQKTYLRNGMQETDYLLFEEILPKPL